MSCEPFQDEPKAKAAECAAQEAGGRQVLTDQRAMEAFLDSLAIKYQTIQHPPVFTVAAMLEHVASLPGLVVKNLFVKVPISKSFSSPFTASHRF